MSMDGAVPPQGGPSRRPAGGPANQPEADCSPGPAASALSPAELDLAAALRSRVAVVGRSGPPPGGLVRIRRKARARQRNRAVLAGSAGILVLAVAVTLATGDRFDLVPKLTSAVGLGGGSAAGSQNGSAGSGHASTAANGGRVVWPTGSSGRDGLAIGPVGPVTGTPSAAAAAMVPLCTSSTVKTSTTVGPTVAGIVYGHVDAVALAPCVVVGPPVLTVANQAGTAAASVTILKANLAVAAQLPAVPTWGTTMVLTAGEGYEFQFAWDAAGCPAASASPTSSDAAANGATTYYLGYAVSGTTPPSAVTLKAACGAQVYVTDLYASGAFPLPNAPVSPPPTSPSAVAATTTTPSTTSSTTPPASPSASPSNSAANATNGTSGTGVTTPSG